MQLPPLLLEGARVGLVAPAGPLRGPDDLDHAIANARRMGWDAVVGEHVLARDGYLAGSDRERLADFNRFASAEDIQGIWCIRGGYGAMRLLEHLDYDSLRRRPKALIGYSDITALHAAVGLRADLVTLHGPTAREDLSELSRASLQRAACDRVNPCGRAAHARTLVGGRARGRLAGGNLALLAALCGTPYALSFDGAILVLEDVGEAVYRIDRMLTQLRLAGALRGLAGLAFGSFTDVDPDPGGVQPALDRLLEEFAAQLGVPCIVGIPMGHVREQWTFPLGAMAELDADACTLVVTEDSFAAA